MDKKKILIVEDERDMLTTLQEALSYEGYETVGAENGKVGLKEALDAHPDLIILDLVMPEMDGMAMLNKLRKDPWGSTVPVIILTNRSNPSDAAEALDQDVYKFLVKANWSIDNVIQEVRRQLPLEK